MRSDSRPGSGSTIWAFLAAIFLVVLSLALSLAQTPSSPTNPAPATATSASAAQTQPSPVVTTDPAHGGISSSAWLNPTVLELDVTHALALGVRQGLASLGIA